jgi:hypothetical protein
MDADRLERLSRTLASGPSRRAVLTGLGALLVGATTTTTPPAVQAEAEDGWIEDEAFGGFCRLPRFPCSNSGQCCAGGCLEDGTCGCRKRGKTAYRKALCCSGKKKRGDKSKCR